VKKVKISVTVVFRIRIGFDYLGGPKGFTKKRKKSRKKISCFEKLFLGSRLLLEPGHLVWGTLE
jgi:hypothetical protein